MAVEMPTTALATAREHAEYASLLLAEVKTRAEAAVMMSPEEHLEAVAEGRLATLNRQIDTWIDLAGKHAATAQALAMTEPPLPGLMPGPTLTLGTALRDHVQDVLAELDDEELDALARAVEERRRDGG